MWTFLYREWARRPWWMNVAFVFCLYMAVINVPLDLIFTPVEGDEEVWFGLVLHGVWAKATEPLHFAIYAAGAYGFWNMRRWMWPWAGLYVLQIAIGTAVWNFTDPRGSGWPGVVVALVFLVPAIALWRARERFAPGG